MPKERGEYQFVIDLKFRWNKAARYCFIARYDMPTYYLTEIISERIPYKGNYSKVVELTGMLPSPDNYFIRNFTLLDFEGENGVSLYGGSLNKSTVRFSDEEPTTEEDRVAYIQDLYEMHLNLRNNARGNNSMTLFYEIRGTTPHSYEWPVEDENSMPYKIMYKNALVLFSMVDNMKEVTFAFRDSQSGYELEQDKYDIRYTFKRTDFETRYGDLTQLGSDLDKLRSLLTFQ